MNAANEGTQALSKYLAERSEKAESLKKEVLESTLKMAAYDRHDHNAVLPLLEIGVDPNAQPPNRTPHDDPDTVLILVVESGNTKVVKIPLDKGADVNAPRVLEAAASCNLEMLRLILEEDADVETFGGPALVSALYHRLWKNR